MKYNLTPENKKHHHPDLSTYRLMKAQQRRAATVNFQNEMAEAHRRANKRLHLMQVNSMLYGRLSPGMRNSLTYRKAALEREVANSLLPLNSR